MKFTLTKTDAGSKARLGILETAHGAIETPVFMPVGTRGAVKTLLHQELLKTRRANYFGQYLPSHAAPRRRYHR